jgi:hypothetical protein
MKRGRLKGEKERRGLDECIDGKPTGDWEQGRAGARRVRCCGMESCAATLGESQEKEDDNN